MASIHIHVPQNNGSTPLKKFLMSNDSYRICKFLVNRIFSVIFAENNIFDPMYEGANTPLEANPPLKGVVLAAGSVECFSGCNYPLFPA